MIITAIETQLEALRPSERLVAHYVLGRPSVVVHMSIADLAESAEVSEPTIMRFCKALGCKGFMEFKLGLARDLERRTFLRNRANPAVKGPVGVGEAVFSRLVTSLSALGKRLKLDQIEEILEWCAASRIVTILHDSSEGKAAQTLVDSLLACRVEANIKTDAAKTRRLDGAVIIALRSAQSLADIEAFARAVGAENGKLVTIGYQNSASHLSLFDVNTDASVDLMADITYLCILEALRAGIATRLSRSGLFSDTTSDILQSQREIAYGDARRRDRQIAEAHQSSNQARQSAFTREDA